MEILRYLKNEEIVGGFYNCILDPYKLSIFEENESDKKAYATDLAVLMGVVEETDPEFIDEEGEEIPYAPYYTYDMDGLNQMNYIVDGLGNLDLVNIDNKTIGNRPVIKYSLIEKYCNTDVMDDGTLLAYFGKYPQNVVNNLEQHVLTEKLESSQLEKTDKVYTLNGEKCAIYKCNNRQFIQYTAKVESESILTNYETVQKGKTYWLEVKPIMWIVDKSKDVAVSSCVLFGGMQFANTGKYFFDEFEESNVGKYLNNEFLNEITEYSKLIRIEAEKIMLQKEQEKIQEENAEEYVRRMIK
jgi:hypothetical protein